MSTLLLPSIFNNSFSICVRHASVRGSICPSGIMILEHRLINISGAPFANSTLLPELPSCHSTLMDLRSLLNSKTALFSIPGAMNEVAMGKSEYLRVILHLCAYSMGVG